MFKAGIIGAAGYTGLELAKILSRHPQVSLEVINSRSLAGKPIKDECPDYEGKDRFTDYSIDEINKKKLDALFLAVPHHCAMPIVPQASCKVIDLSADYRFRDEAIYEKTYSHEHSDKNRKAVYGLPALFRKEIRNAKVVANPGCYATGMLISALPVISDATQIIFDGKSGWSGAGKESIYAKDPGILKDNILAYKISAHRHLFEVRQFLAKPVSFTPHVINTFRGMMITAHILLDKKIKKISEYSIRKKYQEYFIDDPFVEISGGIPDIHMVQNTNKIILGGFEIDEQNRLVVIAVLDNLIKGASGQAVQNMNIMLGMKDQEGLI